MKNTLRLVGLASLCGLSLSSCVVYDPIGGPVAGGYPVAPGATYYSPAPAVSNVSYYDDGNYYNPGYTTFGSPFYRPVGTSFTYISGNGFNDRCDTPRYYGGNNYRHSSSGRGPSSRGFSGSDGGSRSSGSSMMRATSSSRSGFSGSSRGLSGSSSSRPVMRSSGSSGSMQNARPSSAPRSSAPRASGGSSGRGGSMGSFQASGSKSGSSSQKVASLSSYKKKGR